MTAETNFIYRRLYDLLARSLPPADLVLFPAESDRCPARVRGRAPCRERSTSTLRRVSGRTERSLQPLLLPLHGHAAHVDRNVPVRPILGDTLDDLIGQITSMGRGTRYYVPAADAAADAEVLLWRGSRRPGSRLGAPADKTSRVPEGSWVKVSSCGQVIYHRNWKPTSSVPEVRAPLPDRRSRSAGAPADDGVDGTRLNCSPLIAPVHRHETVPRPPEASIRATGRRDAVVSAPPTSMAFRLS